MCATIGADHVCTYAELLLAISKDELGDGLPPVTDGTYWVHRMTETVDVDSMASPPGAGARCNDWFDLDDDSEGEWFEASNGELVFHFDPDTAGGSNQGIGACTELRGILCCFPECPPRPSIGEH